MSLKGRLNLFQLSMLRWREMHPYNAVHLIRVAEPLDAMRLRNTIAAHLQSLGLTGLVLDPTQGRFEYTGGPASVDVAIVDAETGALAAISAEIERQLNLPFARADRLDPFRFFAVDAGNSFHIGVAYDHFIGAGDSTVVLLKGLWERYTGHATDTAPRAPELYPPRFRRLLLRHPIHVLTGLRRLRELPASCRRGFRPRYAGGTDPANAFACVRIERDDARRFAQTAKAWGVTQNDLMIAMLMQALSPLADERHRERRRNELAIASIINLRREFDYGSAEAFGQFSSSFRVSHRVPRGGLRELAQDVRQQTAAIRKERRYFQTLLAMQLSGAIWRFLTPERRANFHCKNYPVWAGTTPLNVDAIWEETGGAKPVPEYVRGVSTGPLAPLVMAATTADGVIHLGATYRRTAFERGIIDNILVHIEHDIQNLVP